MSEFLKKKKIVDVGVQSSPLFLCRKTVLNKYHTFFKTCLERDFKFKLNDETMRGKLRSSVEGKEMVNEITEKEMICRGKCW